MQQWHRNLRYYSSANYRNPNLVERQKNLTLEERSPKVSLQIDGKALEFSAVLLRDACSCPECVHTSTNQRLFSTADIPANIEARCVETDESSDIVSIQWMNDVPGHAKEHTTRFEVGALRDLSHTGFAPGAHKETMLPQVLWSKDKLSLPDYNYNQYMNDDRLLFDLLRQLRTKGLAFVTDVPGTKEALLAIANRIGPAKDTFYGQTWDGK